MKYQRNPQTNLQIRIIKKKSLRGRKDFQCRYVYQYQFKKGDNLILTAFGAGFAWGAIYVKWGYDGKKR